MAKAVGNVYSLYLRSPRSSSTLLHELGNFKIRTTCQSSHFGKISEMKSISKAPLPIEISALCKNL